MGDIRAILCGAVAVASLVAAPAAAEDGPSPVDPARYLAMFDHADLRGVERPPDELYDLFVGITGDSALDARIRDAAEARGYVRRPVATTGLVPVDGRRLQAPAAEAWLALQDAARADGVSLVLTSAFRDLGDQKALFRRRLGGGTSDTAIDAALRTSAPPGYSKHHSGYAIDVGQVGGAAGGFVGTRAYAWLSAFDFARAKAHGFIPSYPPAGVGMGPDPEAWEFVWVGTGRIACAAGAIDASGFCDVADEPRLTDIRWLAELGITVGCAPGRFCPEDPVTRGEAASMLWRLHGAPRTGLVAPFTDVYRTDYFASAVDWLWSLGVVVGTSAETFSPDDFLGPDEALALVVRLDGFEELPAPTGMLGSIPAPPTEPPSVGDLGPHIDRAEFASLLRAGSFR